MSELDRLEKARRAAFWGGLIVVVGSVIVWLLFPIYLVGTQYQRRPIWAPPQIHFGNNLQRIDQADLARLERIPEQKAILDGLRNMPQSVSATPIWIGSRYGLGRNPLLALPLFTLVVWIALLRLTHLI